MPPDWGPRSPGDGYRTRPLLPRPPLIRFVYFDLDNTLLDHSAAERAALADLHAAHPEIGRHELAHVQATYHAENAPLWGAYARREVTRDELHRLRFERTLDRLGAALDPDAVGAAYLARYARHWVWIDGARRAFLDTGARLPVGILTNGFEAQQVAKLARFPEIADASAALVISERVGVQKPDPVIFEHARAAAEAVVGAPLAPHEILYAGDSLSSDVRGGRAAGWHVAWLGGDAAHDAVDVSVSVYDDWATWPALLHRLG